jgi:capsular polysaccharide biosynthesis protein
MSSVLSFQSLTRVWRTLLLTSVLGAVFALALSFLQPLQYASTVRLLITQTTSGTTDPYTALKFTERIAGSLSELLYSSTFANNILQSASGLDTTYFPREEYDKRKLWQKTVETGVSPGTGILTVSAYHPRREQAKILVEAASRELTVQAPNYFGANVRVQVIDAPLDSRWYARPDFPGNILLGFGIGLFLGLAWLLTGSRRLSSVT